MIRKSEVNDLPVPYIYVEGNNRERGIQHGEQCAPLIKKSVETYKYICQTSRGLSWEKLEEEVRGFFDPIEKYDGALFEEMKGISEGSGIPLEQIVLLNVRSEVMNPVWSKTSESEGCTSLVVTPEKAKGRKFFMAQTWDWLYSVKDCLILFHSNDLAGDQFLTVNEAGMVGKIGCNNHNVGVILNYLNSSEITPGGTPYNILLRRVLDSKDIIDAQRNLLRAPIAFGLNIMLGDNEAKTIGYELTGKGIDFYLPKNGYMLHTNHYLSDKLMVKDFLQGSIPHSKARYEFADSFLAEAKNVDVEDIVKLLSTHMNEEYTICRHWKGMAGGGVTLFSIIMEMTEMKMYVCIGTPCDCDFHELELSRIFR